MDQIPNTLPTPQDFETLLEIMNDDYQSVSFSYDMVVDLIECLDPEKKLLFKEVLLYLKAASKALENAHRDLSDSSFMIFGDKDYRWES